MNEGWVRDWIMAVTFRGKKGKVAWTMTSTSNILVPTFLSKPSSDNIHSPNLCPYKNLTVATPLRAKSAKSDGGPRLPDLNGFVK